MDSVKPEAIPTSLWSLLNSRGDFERIAAGELLWQPGDERTERSYIVTRGLLRLFHPSHDGHSVTLLAIGPGGILGHDTNPLKKTYLTGAEALCESQLLGVLIAFLEQCLGMPDALGR